jgi:hypothetical protein
VNLHFAAVYANKLALHGRTWETLTRTEQTVRLNITHVLESYHYFNTPKIVNEVRMGSEKIFLDSGAFSAFTLGETIDITEYCNFCKEHSDVITHCSVLDAIGDAAKTWENQKEMERQGVRALPCFHFGEPEEYLVRYMKEYEYITLGGLARIGLANQIPWLDMIWERYLADPSGNARLKVHGFGITSAQLMARYPWHSIDSASWRLFAINGTIYHRELGPVAMGVKRTARKELDKHWTTFEPRYQQVLRNYIEQRGFTVEGLMNSDLSRSLFNMNSYMEINQQIRSAPPVFRNLQPGLFI